MNGTFVVVKDLQDNTGFLDDLNRLAHSLVKKSDGKLRIAFNEANDSCAHDPEAQEHLKLNEQRLGRDLKLYNFMCEIQGRERTLCDILGEVVLPLKNQAPEAFSAGLDFMESKADVFGNDKDSWIEMVRGFRPKMG